MKTLVVICHSRPELLENCIQSIRNAEGSGDYQKILIQQKGNPKVGEVVQRHLDYFDHVIVTDRKLSSTLNISLNRYLAYQMCFDHLESDFAVVLEDDVEIAYDSLIYVQEVFEKNRRKRDFRGVNLGSGIEFEDSNRFTYSKVRYALQGPASMIPRATRMHFSKMGISHLLSKGIFDGAIESYIKTGFVLMPNVSRYMDFGYSGTHSNVETPSAYFSKLAKSSAPYPAVEMKPFIEKYLAQNWRDDCVKYRRPFNVYFKIRELVIFRNEEQPFKLVWDTYFLFRRLIIRIQRRPG